MSTNFAKGLSVYGAPILPSVGGRMTTGNVFFVGSTSTEDSDAPSSGSNKNTPFTTMDYAVGRMTANNGDIMIVMPGHVETVTAAAGLALDVAGITIIGIGNGTNKPKINFTTAVGASMKTTAANIEMENFQFTGGIDALTNPIHVAAADFKLKNWTYTDVTGQATDVVLTTAAADRMELAYFDYDGATAAGTNAGIALVGGDGIKIHDFFMDGNFAVGGIDVRTTATTDLKVWNVPYFRTRNAADIFLVDTITASTGSIGPEIYLRLQDNAANITEAITGATFVLHQKISVVNLANEVGMEINWTASTDAIV